MLITEMIQPGGDVPYLRIFWRASKRGSSGELSQSLFWCICHSVSKSLRTRVCWMHRSARMITEVCILSVRVELGC